MNVIHIDQCTECGRNGADVPVGFDDFNGAIAQLYICRQCADAAMTEQAMWEEMDKEQRHDVAALGRCRVCGCTENDACHDEQLGPCWWVEQDLCSHCQSNRKEKAP